jgi:hypothetical protein
MEKHPILAVRQKYLRLMNKSNSVLISRRHRKPYATMQSEGGDYSFGEIREGLQDC